LVFGQENPTRLLWGDTHLHSNLSVDGYIFGNRTADADTAYRFAKGQPAIHPYHRAKVQLETPLDFLAVTDHAEFLGIPYSLFTDKDPRLTETRLGRRLVELRSAGEVGACGQADRLGYEPFRSRRRGTTTGNRLDDPPGLEN